jgi:uncharacterized protein (TIGR02284 family)
MNANTNEALAATLNGLVVTLKCSEEGFRGAAIRFTNPKLGDQFITYACERERFASEFQDMVANLGGKPELSGSTACAIHLGWQRLKDSTHGIDDLGILAEAQNGETSVAEYLRCTIAKGLPDEVQEIVEAQLEDVVASRDHLKELQENVVIVAGKPTAKTD